MGPKTRSPAKQASGVSYVKNPQKNAGNQHVVTGIFKNIYVSK